MQHSTVIDRHALHCTALHRTGNRQQVHRLSSDAADRQMHEKGDNHHGEWEWAGDSSMEDRCVVETTGVCVWEQLNCRQGHGQHYTTILKCTLREVHPSLHVMVHSPVPELRTLRRQLPGTDINIQR